MRRLWAALSLVVLVAVLGLASGCVSSSQKDAQTPAGSPTVRNSALQTDSQGKTITAPAATPPAAGGTTSKGGGGAAPAGNAAAGEQVFARSCTSCHLGDGKQAGGVGPQLAGLGLTADRIHTQVVNGGGPMPPGLVSGKDLDNVVAYVVSIQ